MTVKIYLAHPYSHRREAQQVQLALEAEGYLVVNPFNHTAEDIYLTQQWETSFTPALNRRIASKDFEKIESCNLVVAYLPVKSIGTPMEIVYSYHAKKPVIVLTNDDHYYRDHPWLNCFATVATSLSDLVHHVKQLSTGDVNQSW